MSETHPQNVASHIVGQGQKIGQEQKKLRLARKLTPTPPHRLREIAAILGPSATDAAVRQRHNYCVDVCRSRNKVFNKGIEMNRCFTIGIIALGLLSGARSAHAGTVAVSVSGSPVTIQQGSSGTMTATFTLWGSNNPNQNPAITYCDTFTINADGTFACSQLGLLSLNPGQNYTVRGVPTTFTRQITIVVPGTVPCGVPYNGSALFSSSAGTGLNFGNDVLQVSLQFAVNVTCPAVIPTEGCGHGFWKTHSPSWPVGYSDKVLSDIFVLVGDFDSLSTHSLMEALNYDGGPTLLDKGKILLRNAVAAELNAVRFGSSFSYSESQVRELVNDALKSGVKEILALEGEFDLANNAYCPLP